MPAPSSGSSSSAVSGTGDPSPNLKFMSFWKSTANSLNAFPAAGGVTVAAALVPASNVQVDPCGSMIKAPTAPLLLCLIGSDGIRLIAPNSIGVATSVVPDILTSPAYHL